MAEAAAGTRIAALVVAETEALTWAGRCEPGDVLGIADGEVVLIAPDLPVGALWLAHRMLLGGGEIVTALLGAGTDARARRGARGRPAAQPSGGRRRRPPRRPHRLPAGVGGGMTELSTPLVAALGARAADAAGRPAVAAHGRRPAPPLPAPLRRPRAAHRHRGPGDRRAHHGRRAGGEGHAARHALPQRQAARRRDPRREGRRARLHVLQRPQAEVAGQAGGPGRVLRQGRRVQQEASAHPPAVRDPRRRRRDPPLHLRLPGHRQARFPGDRPVGAPGARHGRRRRRSAAVLGARAGEPGRAEPRAAPHPRAREPERHLRRPPPAGVGRGDGRAARARAAAPGHGRTARRRVPAPAGRPAGRRSTPGCRSRSPTASRRSGRRSPPISPGGTR